MGCCNYRQINEEKIIEILVEKRHESIISRNRQQIFNQIIVGKECDQSRDKFYSDINDESKLVDYLQSLQDNNYKEKFEYELLLYLDVLSLNNRCKFTGIYDFSSSINIFKKVISNLSNFKFDEIKKLEYYNNPLDICGREKLLNSENFSLKLKYPLVKGENDYSLYKSYIKEKIEEKRLQMKISLNNPEIYFNHLLQLYFDSIKKADINRLQDLGEMASSLYKHINNYLTRLQKGEKFSEFENKLINILLFAPIIADNKNLDVNRIKYNFLGKNEGNNNICSDNRIVITEKQLIIKHSYELNDVEDKIIDKNEIILSKPEIYNIKLLEKELDEDRIKKQLTEVHFLKYVKLQYFQENNFYTYNNIYWEFNKKILKYIFQSNVIKTLFQNIYQNNIFDSEETVNELFNDLIFVPYPTYKSHGITFKKGLIIFINGLIESYFGPITYLSKSSSFIILGIHEGCSHWASAFYSFLYNDISLFRSVKFSDEILIDIGIINNTNETDLQVSGLLKLDGGDILEKILFGRKLEFFTLNESLFLLCKNSYDVDYKTFKKNFTEVNYKDLFSLYNEVVKDPELNKLMNTFGIDLDYFQELKNADNLNFSFKRNGDIISNSRCGNLTF